MWMRNSLPRCAPNDRVCLSLFGVGWPLSQPLSCTSSTAQRTAIGAVGPLTFPAAIAEKARLLHPRHRLPYALSRCAAGQAIPMALRAGPITPVSAIVFAGTREDARQQYGVHLSLSHEEEVGAAVAWPCVTDAGTPAATVWAVDVADVQQVARLYRRYPQLHSRWLPQCELPQLPGVGEVSGVPRHSETEACNEVHTGHVLDRPEWRATCSTAPEMASAVILAQHWSLRECCVKLLGVPGRAFGYGCVAPPTVALDNPGQGHGARVKPFSCGPLDTGVVYQCELTGKEADVFTEQGLGRQVWCETEVLSLQVTSGTVRHYVVTVAQCSVLYKGGE